jgi:hypothetical protein
MCETACKHARHALVRQEVYRVAEPKANQVFSNRLPMREVTMICMARLLHITGTVDRWGFLLIVSYSPFEQCRRPRPIDCDEIASYVLSDTMKFQQDVETYSWVAYGIQRWCSDIVVKKD